LRERWRLGVARPPTDLAKLSDLSRMTVGTCPKFPARRHPNARYAGSECARTYR
jgi:hypothetical protein